MADPSIPTRASTPDISTSESAILPTKKAVAVRKSITGSGSRPRRRRGRKLILFTKLAPFIWAIIMGLYALAMIVHISVVIFDTTMDDVSLGPMYKIFGTGFEFPDSVYWDDTTGYLHFIDENTNKAYKWTPSMGPKMYQYILMDYRHSYNSLWDTIWKPSRPHRVNSVVPTNYSVDIWISGFGPALVNFEWVGSRFLGKPIDYIHLANVFDEHQEITVAKASPYGSIVTAGTDKQIKASTRARVARFHKVVTHFDLHYTKDFTDQLVHVTGMAWSTDIEYLYMCDTLLFKILSFRYILDSGNESLANPFTLITFTDKPYDIEMDGEDYLWVTLMTLNQVVRVSTAPGDDGQRIKAVYNSPGVITIGLTLGGLKKDMLYVSTGTKVPSGLKTVENVRTKSKGNFYALNVTIKPSPTFHINLEAIMPPPLIEF